MVAYRFEDSRGGDCVARHMRGFAGILQVDGYAAYAQLAKAKAGTNETVTLAGCWSHLRRRFYELHINGTSVSAPPGPYGFGLEVLRKRHGMRSSRAL